MGWGRVEIRAHLINTGWGRSWRNARVLEGFGASVPARPLAHLLASSSLNCTVVPLVVLLVARRCRSILWCRRCSRCSRCWP